MSGSEQVLRQQPPSCERRTGFDPAVKPAPRQKGRRFPIKSHSAATNLCDRDRPPLGGQTQSARRTAPAGKPAPRQRGRRFPIMSLPKTTGPCAGAPSAGRPALRQADRFSGKIPFRANSHATGGRGGTDHDRIGRIKAHKNPGRNRSGRDLSVDAHAASGTPEAIRIRPVRSWARHRARAAPRGSRSCRRCSHSARCSPATNAAVAWRARA